MKCDKCGKELAGETFADLTFVEKDDEGKVIKVEQFKLCGRCAWEELTNEGFA